MLNQTKRLKKHTRGSDIPDKPVELSCSRVLVIACGLHGVTPVKQDLHGQHDAKVPGSRAAGSKPQREKIGLYQDCVERER